MKIERAAPSVATSQRDPHMDYVKHRAWFRMPTPMQPPYQDNSQSVRSKPCIHWNSYSVFSPTNKTLIRVKEQFHFVKLGVATCRLDHGSKFWLRGQWEVHGVVGQLQRTSPTHQTEDKGGRPNSGESRRRNPDPRNYP